MGLDLRGGGGGCESEGFVSELKQSGEGFKYSEVEGILLWVFSFERSLSVWLVGGGG